MRYLSTIVTALAAPLLVSAAPHSRRAGVDPADLLVLKFAHVLELFESSFYQQALSLFKDNDFTAAGFTTVQVPLEQISAILEDETLHAKTLEGQIIASGDKPISGCKFNLDSSLKDVKTMVATARVVELVGVNAYTGALSLMKEPRLLTAAATIATIESRHQSALNLFSPPGSVIPSAFDIALAPGEVLALVSPFISECDLGIKANTPLSITNTGVPTPGTVLTFEAKTINDTISKDKLFCQMLVGGQPFTFTFPLAQCAVPKDINGPVAIWVTSDNQALLNNPIDRPQSNNIIAGPALAFVDTKPQAISQLVVGGKVDGNDNSGKQTTATLTFPSGATNSGSVPSVTPGGTPTVSPSSFTGNTYTGMTGDGSMDINGWS